MSETSHPSFSSRPPYLSVRDLSIGYDNIPLIRGINLSLEQGKILTLIGPNGSGKSTLLRTLSGQLPPLSGTIVINEKKLLPGKRETARRIAVMMTERVSARRMTCREVVSLGRYPYTGTLGMLSQHDQSVVDDSMAAAHVTEYAGREFNSLSDGQKQRVLLARAICQEPGLMILDEPTSYLDIRYQLELLSVLKDLASQKQVTIVMSLHELNLARRIAHQMVCLKDGAIHRRGTPEEIFAGDYLDRLYDLPSGTCRELGLSD